MRVSTLQSSQAAMAGIQARQAEQDRLQNQLSTGLRVSSPGDDPLAAAQAELIRSQLSRIESNQRAASFSSSLLSSADGALAQGVDVLQGVREALISAANAAYSSNDRDALASTLQAARSKLLTVANMRDASGGFVFAGQGTNNLPVTGGSTSVYTPASGDQRLGPEGQYAGSIDGRYVFFSIPKGNGVFVPSSAPSNAGTASVDAGEVIDSSQLTGHAYQVLISGAPGALQYEITDQTNQTTVISGNAFESGQPIVVDGQKIVIAGTPTAGDRFDIVPAGQQSAFQTIDQAIALLGDHALSVSQYGEKLTAIQASLDGALGRMTLARTEVGEEMNANDASTNLNQSRQLDLKSRQSDWQDLDYAQAISDMQINQTSLQAALRSYAAFSKISLFDILS